MPLVLNLIYLALLVVFSPLLLYRAGPLGEVPRGLVARSSWARPRSGSATGPASGSTR